jgi:hypothetical protein
LAKTGALQIRDVLRVIEQAGLGPGRGPCLDCGARLRAGDQDRWRNAYAKPKRNVAPELMIRSWTDYKINVA